MHNGMNIYEALTVVQVCFY